jgi:CRP/FNR family transcriptional regulator
MTSLIEHPRHSGPGNAPTAHPHFGANLGAQSARRLDADEGLFFEGEPALSVFKVVRGLVRCFRVTEDGRRHICRFAGPGDMLGLGMNRTYRYSAEAVSSSLVARAPRSAIEGGADVAARDGLWQALVDELAQRERVQLRLSRMTANERVADFLLELIESQNGESTAAFHIPMSRRDIADHLGLTLETVSRCLHRLNWMSVIELIDAHSFRLRQAGVLGRLAAGDRDGEVVRAA